MRCAGRCVAIASALLFWGAAPAARVDAQIAVIVNRNSPVSDLKVEDLRRLYLGLSPTFAGGRPVVLLELPPLRAAFYQRLLGLTEDRVKRRWIANVFSGRSVTPPREIETAAELKRFVAGHPAALAFIDVRDVDATVKVVTIDGRAPASPAYRFR